MPQLAKVLTEDDFQPQPRTVQIDLTAYLAIIDAITREGGVGATVKLGPEESQRAEKRRLTMAAGRQGYRLVWRRALQPGSVRFVLAKEGEPVPGGRKRREPPPPPAKGGRTRR